MSATGMSVEGDPLRPRSPYSASKAGGELQVQAYRSSYGFPAIVTRGSNTYGPFQYPEKIIPLFITNAIDDRPLPIYGDGGAVRDYLYVEDHVRGIDRALRHGKPGSTTTSALAERPMASRSPTPSCGLLGKPSSLKQFVRDRLGHDRRYAVDSTRLAELGWRPTLSFEAGMERTVAWFVEHEEWWRPLKSGEFWEFYQRNYQPAVETRAASVVDAMPATCVTRMPATLGAGTHRGC